MKSILLLKSNAAVFLISILLFSFAIGGEVFFQGGDVSFVPQVEDNGGVYRDRGKVKDPFDILKDHGMNTIRLKLWHTPSENYNTLEKVIHMAKRIKSHNMYFLLNFHYSDTWADPGKQYKPKAWEDLSFEELKDSVYRYTRDVISCLYKNKVMPDIVQVGNEITPGFLWPDGRVGGSYDTPEQWQKFTALLKEAIRGVKEAGPGSDSIKIMIHIDRGGDNKGARWFFDNLLKHDVDFDFIGLSFYPWWHGTLNDLRYNLNDLAVRYNKEIIVVETAYPWTLDNADKVGNIVSSIDQLHSGYPATVEGQAKFLKDLITIVKNVKNNKGIGVIYWAPTWISTPNMGSAWENNALFDFEGNALESLDIFSETPEDTIKINVKLRLNTSTHYDTLRPYHFVQVRGELKNSLLDILPDGRKLSWYSDSELIMENIEGDYWQVVFEMRPGDTLLYKFWTGYNRNRPTYLRLGWEGPILPFQGKGNTRIFIAGENDTILPIQFYNSTGEALPQYWKPYEVKDNYLAIFFRVNLAKLMKSGIFDPEVNGPVGLRGDSTITSGQLSWNKTSFFLHREENSVYNGSFWSGTLYIPKSGLKAGDSLNYSFYIENINGGGYTEQNVPKRRLVITSSLLTQVNDTTLHWVYFNEPGYNKIKTEVEKAKLYAIRNIYPNPFNNRVYVKYNIPENSNVTINIFDLSGGIVKELVKGKYNGGEYIVSWDGKNEDGKLVSSGVYLITFISNNIVEAKKVLFLK